jgi:hypothetical protein
MVGRCPRAMSTRRSKSWETSLPLTRSTAEPRGVFPCPASASSMDRSIASKDSSVHRSPASSLIVRLLSMNARSDWGEHPGLESRTSQHLRLKQGARRASGRVRCRHHRETTGNARLFSLVLESEIASVSISSFMGFKQSQYKPRGRNCPNFEEDKCLVGMSRPVGFTSQ